MGRARDPGGSRGHRTALVNLLDNAVKYSADQTGSRSRPLQPGFAVFEVTDQHRHREDGHGRHLRKFYRGSGASVHREGFGLGLPIVQELVNAHHGRVEVDSVLGEGSTFRVVLPSAPPEPAPSDQPAAAHARGQEIV